jgi:hypothetical protein
MRRLAPLLLVLAAAACDDPSNPRQLWIAPTGDSLKLVDAEPHPF